MLHGLWGEKYWVDASTLYKKVCRCCPRLTTPLASKPCYHDICIKEWLLFMYRLLKDADFKRKFDELPQFDPDNPESCMHLPISPWDVISGCRKRRRLSIGQCSTDSSDHPSSQSKRHLP